MKTLIPEHTTNYEGKKRRIGFELEFSGLSVEQSALLVQEQYGGELKRKHKNLIEVSHSTLGKFVIELDADFLKKLAEKSENKKESNKINMDEHLEKVLSKALSDVVPVEIVFPPVDYDLVSECDKLVTKLNEQGAAGTKGFLLAGFGVHINVEALSLEPKVLLAFIQAFILLEPWLRKRLDVDLARRILPFIQTYKTKYKKLVLSEYYQPKIDELIQDYVKHNTSRNYALDMLPLFCFINPDAVADKVSMRLITPRPTFHYRLPNCNLGNQQWSLTKEFQYWLIIEKLAFNSELRQEMCRAYLSYKFIPLSLIQNQWIKKTEKYVERLL